MNLQDVRDIIQSHHLADLVTKGTEFPNISTVHYFFHDGVILLTSSIMFSERLQNIKNCSDIGLLISKEGKQISIQGKAQILDSSLEEGWKKFENDWFAKDVFSSKLREETHIPIFWKRVVIHILPEVIRYRDSEETTTFELEVTL
ncbi:MAG: pyridoxamine 5'-phosphate oxidase family protein [Candidatus Heimdallarchaeota archaeon]|nr:pyridoxamine 5'-phosphate oxidase family protein [Candidatus Heimdallarchaeota archaeon]